MSGPENCERKKPGDRGGAGSCKTQQSGVECLKSLARNGDCPWNSIESEEDKSDVRVRKSVEKRGLVGRDLYARVWKVKG